MIGKKYNFNDVFMRDLTICVLAMLEERIGWVNRFSSSTKQVDVPFFYSLTGKNDDYLLDSFVDDIPDKDRKSELNTDVIPRGHCTLKSFRTKSEEFANPNIWLRQVVENEEEIRKVLTKIRAIPITASYETTILVSSELDVFKSSESILTSLLFYEHMYFEHNFMYIDAVVTFQDDNSIEINRDVGMEGNDLIKINFNFDVQTYYPAFGEEQIFGRPRESKWINQLKRSVTSEIKQEEMKERYSSDINQAST